MKKFLTICFAIIVCFSALVSAQIPKNTLIQIVTAEDELRFDKTLEDLMNSKNLQIRSRAVLAAGRIGDERAIDALSKILTELGDSEVRAMAAFAIGEIESIKGADAILKVLGKFGQDPHLRASAIEAAGKIAAANAKEEKSKDLSKAILDNLKFEAGRRSRSDENVILLGITAVLRAKPENSEEVVAEFLTYSNWRIRADALNTLARLRAKNVNEKARELLVKDENPIVRANAARALGAAEDKDSVNMLLESATTDKDLRVRINAIRSLGSLKNEKSADKLLTRGEKLLVDYKKSKFANPVEKNELLDITTALGNILKGTENKRAVKFLEEFRQAEKHQSPEIEIALVRVSPETYIRTKHPKDIDWKGLSSYAQALGELIDFKEESARSSKKAAEMLLRGEINESILKKVKPNKSFPSFLTAYAKFQNDDFRIALLKSLKQDDVIIRATAANLLGDIKPETPEQAVEIYRELSDALWKARTDKLNDASLAILDALKKQYENRPNPMPLKVAYMTPFISAIESPDYLIRRKGVEIYKGFDIQKPDPKTVGNPDFKPFEVPENTDIVNFSEDLKDGSKSRVFRTDYVRALSRKNGKSKAILTTEKGNITIEFFPEEAPLTVDNFINLAKSGYFNGLEIHRVVPNFVVQDGDPRGDGSGGPGWQIRCEINQIPYERGTVGMALSGKDTGGSQWFVAHSPQPHLDGGYTVFGRVNETDMKIVDMLVRGDRILKIEIVEKR